MKRHAHAAFAFAFAFALVLVLAALLLPVATVSAKDKSTPRAVDGYANGQIFNGKQNMPTVLYGVAQDWDKSCIGGDAKSCMRLGSAFEKGLGRPAEGVQRPVKRRRLSSYAEPV